MSPGTLISITALMVCAITYGLLVAGWRVRPDAIVAPVFLGVCNTIAFGYILRGLV
jgi:hypothetical protein